LKRIGRPRRALDASPGLARVRAVLTPAVDQHLPDRHAGTGGAHLARRLRTGRLGSSPRQRPPAPARARSGAAVLHLRRPGRTDPGVHVARRAGVGLRPRGPRKDADVNGDQAPRDLSDAALERLQALGYVLRGATSCGSSTTARRQRRENPRAYGRGSACDQRLFGQHDVRWIPAGHPGEGNPMAFDNGDGRPGGSYSAVVEITPPLARDGRYSLAHGAAFGPDRRPGRTARGTGVPSSPTSFRGPTACRTAAPSSAPDPRDASSR
jgi:hypothetical protein